MTDTKTPDRIDVMVCALMAGATLDEVGREHGITRERVRQLIAKRGVKSIRDHRSTKKGGFVPLDPMDVRFRYGWSRLPAIYWRTHRRNRGKRRAVIGALRAKYAEVGGPLRFDDMLAATGHNVPVLAALFGRRKGAPFREKNPEYTRYLDRMCRVAGVERVRDAGMNGHRDKGRSTLRAKRTQGKRTRRRMWAFVTASLRSGHRPNVREIRAAGGLTGGTKVGLYWTRGTASTGLKRLFFWAERSARQESYRTTRSDL